MLVFWNITLLHNMGTDSAHGDAVWYIVSNQPTIDIMIFRSRPYGPREKPLWMNYSVDLFVQNSPAAY